MRFFAIHRELEEEMGQGVAKVSRLITVQVTAGFSDQQSATEPAGETDAEEAPATEAASEEMEAVEKTARYDVCVEGHKQFFGMATPFNKYVGNTYPRAPENQPDGIWVYADGTCEYARKRLDVVSSIDVGGRPGCTQLDIRQWVSHLACVVGEEVVATVISRCMSE